MSRILAVGSKESLSRLSETDSGIVPLQLIRFEAVPVCFPDGEFDWVFFGSRRGVRFFLNGIPADALRGMSVGCVGEKTAAAARGEGLKVKFVPSRYSSTYWPEEFLAKFPNARGILFPTSDRSAFEIPKSFVKKGISFRKLVVYRTLCADTEFPAGEFRGVVFASPSCFKCFLEKWGKDKLSGKILVAIGDVTAEAIMETGLSCSIPDRFTMADAVRHCRKKIGTI
ncbi:MAG: uroporphyrinogen-III synthase [Acidobacteria bacterium]|nr:uroporphyrinogen-III synthase [Acidobacteriota bacterium]